MILAGTGTTDSRTKVARDLSEILRLSGGLADQAIHHARSRMLPGDRAAVARAHVGSPSEWAEQVAAEELQHLAKCRKADHTHCRYAERADDEDEDDEPPLQTLVFWSEAWRTQHGYSLDRRPTIESEVNFLRGALEWAWDNELHWDDFCADIRRTRVRLENTVNAGKRSTRSRVECSECDAHPRLLMLHGAGEDTDVWKCPACRHRYLRDDMLRAHAAQLRRESAARYVDQADAIGTLVAQGRHDRTVRKWLEPPRRHVADRCTECRRRWPAQEHSSCPGRMVDDGRPETCGGDLVPVRRGDAEAVVGGYCDIRTRKVWVWWPDLWRLHLATPTRRKASA